MSPCCLWQYRIIPALRLKHRSGGSPRQEPPQAAVALRSASLRLGVRHGTCVAKMLDNVGLRCPHRASGQKPLALCDRCPCFGSLHPPLAALTFAAQSIICAFGLAAAAPRSPYRHLELCGIALSFAIIPHFTAISFYFSEKACIIRKYAILKRQENPMKLKNFRRVAAPWHGCRHDCCACGLRQYR